MTKHFALAGASSIWITGRALDALVETQKEIEELVPGVKIHSLTADLTVPDSVTKLFEGIGADVPDILLNNAGISQAATLLGDSDPKLWWGDFEVNVHGFYLVARAWIRALNGKPGILVATSTSVSDMADRNMSSYGSSKMAVNRIVEIIQLEYAQQGVHAVAMHPGGIASTGMGQNAPQQYRHRLNDTVDLAACTALYLATPAASYLAGRFVYSNWDFERVEKQKEQIKEKNLLVSRINYGDVLSAELTGVPPA